MFIRALFCLLLCIFELEAATKPDRFAFLKALRNEAPAWMVEQINQDLAPYRNGITRSMIDNVLATFDPRIHLLVRFKVANNKVSYSHNLDTGHPILKERAEAYSQALQFLSDTIGLPNVDFALTLHDWSGLPVNDKLPVFAYGRNDRQCKAILIPDFIALDGYPPHYLGGCTPGSNMWQQVPWDSKVQKAFWRGSTTGGQYTKQNWHTFPRTQLALFSLQHPDLLDAKITQVVQAESGVEQILADHQLMGNFASIADQMKYRYLIDVDGNGWTVPRCFWILLSNSLLIKQDSDWIIWYSRGVIPYKHFVPVSRYPEDIFGKIEWAINHDAEAHQIAKQASQFAQNDLSLENTYLYLYKLITEYAKLQKG